MIKKALHIGKQVVAPSLIKYLVVGVTAFLAEYLSFIFLIRSLSLAVLLANAISFALGLLTSFLLNKFWTFGTKTYHHRTSRQFQMYVGLAFANLVATLLLVQLFTAIGIAPEIGKLMAMVVTSLWNYFIFQKIIFKHSSTEEI